MNWKIRLRAAGVHLISCLTVAALAAAVVFLVWYPWPYQVVSGGQDLFILLVTVDIIMGPLITLAIFNINKPKAELRRDLAIIVVLQLAALIFGLHTVYAVRPAVLALEIDRFRVSTAIDIANSELDLAPDEFKTLSITGPRLVDTRAPKDEERYNAIVLGMNGVDLGSRPSFWKNWDESSRQRTLKFGKPLTDWLSQHPSDLDKLQPAIERTGRPASQLLYLPMLARRTDWSVLVDKTTGDPVGFAPIDAP
ncbi:TfpX/TfpZ family type IV pilin accessory protein [Roseateles amylovorans]|uniref:Pilus assembly protein n=1 Tax=Roseateles amylovorans TaxID=2978473 RepID=A0ABY6B2H4_9BURK|nr:TfpX/TfpZ family type IV pilin accessory protein [Roseateles amylovorans]UXH78184.1 pilus assembly protein [Roseateles amylovorans]